MPSMKLIKILGHVAFAEYDKRIPHDWREPRLEPERSHFHNCLKPNERVGIPNMPIPFFKPDNMNKYHQDACNMMGKQFKEFHDTMLDAIIEAHDKWRMSAAFAGVQIQAVAAIGTPGCLTGPDLEPLIKNASPCASMQGSMAAYRDAVAAGLGKAFGIWQKGVAIPGLPWYPLFAASPSPVAPPTPNVPMPLITCPSPGMIGMCVPGVLQNVMHLSLDRSVRDKDEDNKHKTLFAAIEATINVGFTIWLATQQVTNVMGTGPVPSWTPVSPVGPVVMGTTLPGTHLMA